MTVVKLEHSNLAQHQASIFKQLRAFRKEGQLCDIVLKSNDGKEHRAHTAILCAASEDLKNMLLGPFREANQVQRGQPVEMAASDAVVFALLEYIYGEQLQVKLEDCLELLRLADAYNFTELAAAIKASICASLDSAPVTAALNVLQQTQGLRELKAACEKKVAAHFEMCIETANFLELSAVQLGRILQRPDLSVSREEVVVKGLFKWFNKSKDRGIHLGLLLQHIDFRSLSSSNLARLGHLSASMGPAGHDLQQEVGDALEVHRKRSAEGTPDDAVRPKRRCLQLWSPDLGASSQATRKMLPFACSMCWHNGAIYGAIPAGPHHYCASIFRWRPGDAEIQTVAGRGARVNGVNDLGTTCEVSVSPEGKIIVNDWLKHRLLTFENGSGNVLLSDVSFASMFCPPSGVVYGATNSGRVKKLVGARLHPLISGQQLSAELQFSASALFVTKDETVYILDIATSRILRLKQGDTEPVVVGEAPNEESSELQNLFVTEEEKIYVADSGQRKVWAFHPGDAWTEVWACPVGEPRAICVQGRSLYVSVATDDADAWGIYEYLLPPELQLE